MNVLLRQWKADDTGSLASLANNKNIAANLRDIFPHPYTLKDAEEWVSLNKDRKPVTNFAIEVNGELAGSCGIKVPEDVYRFSAEIGYWVAEPLWGKGICDKSGAIAA